MHKIRTVAQVASEFASPLFDGRKVVQCHGVFDLLHIGHIRHLQEARQLGDYLVVTLTPDRFVNKGPHRPAFDAATRAEAIAALECVDAVCVNEWPTAVEAIEQIKPTVFVKGAVKGDGPRDRNGAIDFERRAVESAGGRIVLTDTEFSSASALINRHTDIFTPQTRAFLDSFRENYSAVHLVDELAQMQSMRVLVVGESWVEAGATKAAGLDDHPRERYVGGSLAVANVLSSLCDEVLVLTTGTGEGATEDFLSKNKSEGVEIEFLASDVTSDTQVEDSLNRLLDRANVVLHSDSRTGFISTRAKALMRDRASYYAVDLRDDPDTSLDHAREDVEPDHTQSDLLMTSESQTAPLVQRFAFESECRQTLVMRRDDTALLYDAHERAYVEIPPLPVTEANRVDELGSREAFFALAAGAGAKGLDAVALGFIGSVARAAASTQAGSGRVLDATSLYRQIDSLLK
ncbi:MAG: rfaE bifunctional protein nucleotidyltransferase chain/domain [Myxococcota bacterium]|jgi:rfaE bifunctional protein nucleotidyltransferase chain/domain